MSQHSKPDTGDALSDFLNTPLSIGNTAISKRLVLAPMTYLGHVAFRELVSAFGGYGLLFSEMCGAKRVPHENKTVSPCFRWRAGELPRLVCQIFGSDPETMAIAAKRIDREGFFGVDINFGCANTNICRQNSGAALLKTPDLAAKIVAAVRRAVSCPVFVKFRTGWKDDPEIAAILAKRFQDAGADALTFHPRVAPDRRSRPPKWDHIRLVKNAVSIPVFGNGNVFDQVGCMKMVRSTGCDGVAIGRIAIAKPWIFAMWTDGFRPGPETYFETAMKHAELLSKHFEPPRAIRRFRRFMLYFSANFRFGHTLFSSVRNVKDLVQARDVMKQFFETDPDIAENPNMTFFL